MANAVALFASSIAPGAQLFTLGTPLFLLRGAELTHLLSSFFPRPDRSVTRAHRSVTSFGAPFPGAVPSAAGGKQRYSQQAKDQQFHAVIDEGNPDLFRKIFELQDGGFLDSPAFGETLHIQVVGVDHAGLAMEDQVRENAARGGRMHHAVSAEAVGEVESTEVGRGP